MTLLDRYQSSLFSFQQSRFQLLTNHAAISAQTHVFHENVKEQMSIGTTTTYNFNALIR